MFLLPSRLAWFAILLIAAPAASPAQTKEDVPARTIGVRTALEKAEWVETGQGLQVLQARSEAGQSITAFRISPDHFAFALAIQQEAKGERVDVFVVAIEQIGVDLVVVGVVVVVEEPVVEVVRILVI